MSKSIRVLLADSETLVRECTTCCLLQNGFTVVAEAESIADLLTLATRHRPDVIVAEACMARLRPSSRWNVDGTTIPMRLKQNDVHASVVHFSRSNDETHKVRSRCLGAHAYVGKNEENSVKLLVNAIHAAVRPTPPLDKAGKANRVQTMLPAFTGGDDYRLTFRERQVVTLISHGFTNVEIGFTLSISVETVKEHIKHIFAKMKLRDRTYIGVVALRDQLCR